MDESKEAEAKYKAEIKEHLEFVVEQAGKGPFTKNGEEKKLRIVDIRLAYDVKEMHSAMRRRGAIARKLDIVITWENFKTN